ncbi:MAG: hypothetical protein WCX69_01395 [Candidatus Paceibacterota bacterium]
MELKRLPKENRILLIGFFSVVAVGIGFFVWRNYSNTRDSLPAACTQEAKLCPGGLSVSRSGPDCEFLPCPPEPSTETCGGGVCPAKNESETSGFKSKAVEKAIKDYFLTQEKFSWKTKSNSFNFCAVQNLDPENEIFPYYVWVYCGEYSIEGGKLVLASGTSLPAKINYPNELSFYDLGRFTDEVPRDGSFNDEDIKRIFPEKVRQRFSGFDREGMIKKLETTAFDAISTWDAIRLAISECRAVKAFQSHSKDVSLELKNGSKLVAVEPDIDDIIATVDAARAKCGDIPIGTE